MTDTERGLVTIPPAAMPALTIEQALVRRNQQREFIAQVLIKDQDYGEIPGTKKDTLLKPGAEKLLMFFGLRPRFEAIQTVEDWTGKDFGGEPFFYYHQKCIVYRDGETMAEGDGSCNSRETKYRYRQGERKCPSCRAATIIKGKAEYGGGWLCYGRKGGCGAKFKDGDAAIEGQQTGRVLNVDVADLTNTILKMAQKRALVAATLIGVNASEYFTQDMEDLPHTEATDGEVRDLTEEIRKPVQKSAPTTDHPIDAALAKAKAADQPGPVKPRNLGEMKMRLNELAHEWYGESAGIQLNSHLKKHYKKSLGDLDAQIIQVEIGVYEERLAQRKAGVPAAVSAPIETPADLASFTGEDIEQEAQA